MADLRGFDANKVEPATPFEPIPAGKYLAMITSFGDEAQQGEHGALPRVALHDH